MDIINDESELKEIFGEGFGSHGPVGKWTASSGKEYEVWYCGLCKCFSIMCLEIECYGSSCNGGGCDICVDDFKEFNKLEWKPE